MKKHFLLTVVFILTVICSTSRTYSATYDMTGVWRYTISNNRQTGGNVYCQPDPDRVSVGYVVQSGDTASLTGEGKTFNGPVTGATYNFSFDASTYGETNWIWIDFTLSDYKNGSGALTWYWEDDWGYWCMGEADFTIYKLDNAPSLNATGIWSYSTSQSWSDSCTPDPSESGYTALVQNDNTFTYIDYFGIHTGRVSDRYYYCTINYYEDYGITYQTLFIEMDPNGTTGSGTIVWNWTDGYSSCSGGSRINVAKSTIAPVFNATGQWTLATSNHSSSGNNPGTGTTVETTISQEGETFRLAYQGVQNGLVSGNDYISYFSYPRDNGYAVGAMVFSLDSSASASGSAGWYWTNGYQFEYGSYDLVLNKEPTANTPPDRPVLSLPADGAVNVSLTPLLSTGQFGDTDDGDRQRQTEWQISKTPDFYKTVLNITSTVHLTTLTVPKHILSEHNTYYWRVKFYDLKTAASPWSNVYSFTTAFLGTDLNQNGIPDSQEDNDLDMDNDGTKDNLQNDIKSLKVGAKGAIGVSRKNDTTVLAINAIESINPSSISSILRPYDMPLDMLVLNLSVAKPIDACEIKFHFSETVGPGAKWLMYNSVHGWHDFTQQVSFDGNTAIIKLKDWGYGDADGIPDGNIVDPGGFCYASFVKGMITDSKTQQPIEHAAVSVLGEIIPAQVGGNYFSPIIPGTYTLTASATGYRQKSVQNIVIGQGDIRTLSFDLQPIPAFGLMDAISILQIVSGLAPTSDLPAEMDVNDDHQVGLEEVIFILQQISGLR